MRVFAHGIQGLAAEGIHLALCARGAERIRQTAEDITTEFGVRCLGVPADVSKAEDIRNFVGVVEAEFGGVDILINNAGVGSEETVMEAPDEKWQYYWDLQVMASVRLSRGLIPFMRQRGWGVIINNASDSGLVGEPNLAAYCASKGAVVLLTKAMAMPATPGETTSLAAA